MTTQYAKVNTVCGSIAPYSGTYFAIRVAALGTGEQSKAEFADDMRLADAVFAKGIAELQAIRFPHAAQRKALVKLISGLQTYRHGIGSAITAAEKNDTREWRRVERYFDLAAEACTNYLKFAAQDRMKGVEAL